MGKSQFTKQTFHFQSDLAQRRHILPERADGADDSGGQNNP